MFYRLNEMDVLDIFLGFMIVEEGIAEDDEGIVID